MSFGIVVRVKGEYALFTRPEMKVERVSYDVPTPSAARGIIEAIYWKPAIRWVIDRIHILNPIIFTNIRRNEVSDKVPYSTARSLMQGTIKKNIQPPCRCSHSQAHITPTKTSIWPHCCGRDSIRGAQK